MSIATPDATPAPAAGTPPAGTPPAPAGDAKPAGSTIATSDPKPANPPAGDAKPADQKPDDKGEVKFDLKMPEGSKLAAEHAKQVEAFAKEHKLTPEQAQKILDRDHAALNSQIEMLQAKSKEWASAVEADKDLGGANFNRTKEDARRAIVKFDPSGELARELDATGYGNHPAFVRFVAAIGRAMAEDTIHTGEQSPRAKPLEDRLYTTMSASK